MTLECSALVFDAYGTLFDVHSVAQLAESLFPGKGASLSQAWRAKQLEYTWLKSLMGRYEDFNSVTAASLDWAIASQRIVAGEGAKQALVDEYRRLGRWAPELVELMVQRLFAGRGGTLIDIGANIGLVCVPVIERIYSSVGRSIRRVRMTISTTSTGKKTSDTAAPMPRRRAPSAVM